MTIEEAEKADEPLSHESAVFLLGQFAFDHFVMGEPAEWWDAHVEAVLGAREEAVRKAERERTSAVRDELIEMVWQFAYRNGEDDHSPLTTGGLSALESAFRFLGLPDPCTVDELNRIADAERARSSEEAGNG